MGQKIFPLLISIIILVVSLLSIVGFYSQQNKNNPLKPRKPTITNTPDPSIKEDSFVEITLHIDPNQSQPTISTIRKFKKNAPKSKFEPESIYFISFFDATGNNISSYGFKIEQDIYVDYIRNNKMVGDRRRRKPTDIVLNVSLPKNTSTIALENIDHQILEKKHVDNLAYTQVIPHYISLQNDMTGGVVTSANAAAKGDTVSIVFIGDKYTSMSAFHSDVTKFTQELLKYEPIKSRSNQFAFSYVDNTQDLGCNTSGTEDMTCDERKIAGILNDSGVHYELISVIVNTSVYGGNASQQQYAKMTSAYNGTNNGWGDGPQVYVHEMGHALGDLNDEYNDAHVDVLDGSTRKNCYAGKPPSSEWQGIVSGSDYYLGCEAANFYRSSPSSIMRDYAPFFNPISQKYLNEGIDYYTKPLGKINLTLNIINPSNTNILITAIDDKGVTHFCTQSKGIPVNFQKQITGLACDYLPQDMTYSLIVSDINNSSYGGFLRFTFPSGSTPTVTINVYLPKVWSYTLTCSNGNFSYTRSTNNLFIGKCFKITTNGSPDHLGCGWGGSDKGNGILGLFYKEGQSYTMRGRIWNSQQEMDANNTPVIDESITMQCGFSPTSTPTPHAYSISSGETWFEAENYTNSSIGTWQPSADTTASGGKYMYLNTSSSGRGNVLDVMEYSVNIATTTKYYIWYRGIKSPNSSDGIYIQIDNGTKYMAKLDSSSWKWHLDNDISAGINLSPGTHKIRIYNRYELSKIDKLLLTTNASYQPSGIGGISLPKP